MVQSRVLRSILKFPKYSHESPAAFCLRRGKQFATYVKKYSCKWSHRWSLSVTKWVQHVKMHPNGHSALLMSVQNSQWLVDQRANFSLTGNRSLLGGRTGTRTAKGRPLRYQDCADLIQENPERLDKVKIAALNMICMHFSK